MKKKRGYKERFSKAEIFLLAALNRADKIYERDIRNDRIITGRHTKKELEAVHIYHNEEYKKARNHMKLIFKNLRIEIAKSLLGVNTKKMREEESYEKKKKRNNLKSRFSKQMKSLKRKGCIEYERINPHKLYNSPSINYDITTKGHLVLKEHSI